MKMKSVFGTTVFFLTLSSIAAGANSGPGGQDPGNGNPGPAPLAALSCVEAANAFTATTQTSGSISVACPEGFKATGGGYKIISTQNRRMAPGAHALTTCAGDGFVLGGNNFGYSYPAGNGWGVQYSLDGGKCVEVDAICCKVDEGEETE